MPASPEGGGHAAADDSTVAMFQSEWDNYRKMVSLHHINARRLVPPRGGWPKRTAIELIERLCDRKVVRRARSARGATTAAASIVCSQWVNNLDHLDDPGDRDAAELGVALDRFFVLGEVDAERLVA